MINRRKQFRKPLSTFATIEFNGKKYITKNDIKYTKFDTIKKGIMIDDISLNGISFFFHTKVNYTIPIDNIITIMYNICNNDYTENYKVIHFYNNIYGCSLVNAPLYQRSKGFCLK